MCASRDKSTLHEISHFTKVKVYRTIPTTAFKSEASRGHQESRRGKKNICTGKEEEKCIRRERKGRIKQKARMWFRNSFRVSVSAQGFPKRILLHREASAIDRACIVWRIRALHCISQYFRKPQTRSKDSLIGSASLP